jgi:hypothetical protein
MAKAQIQTQEVTRVTVDEVQERLRRGESLAFVDVRNPQAWAAAARGSTRPHGDHLLYLTARSIKRPGGANLTGERLEECTSAVWRL